MKKILFVCVKNSCRSQIAEGFANEYGKGIAEVFSAGSRPSGIINENAINVMQEVNIDISLNKSKGFNDLPVKKFDYVITLGCKDICPFIPADKHIEWNIKDPEGKDLKFFREVRDNIEKHVKTLLENISKITS